MPTQAQQRQWRHSVEHLLKELDASKRYDSRQRELKRGRPSSDARARPLEFDRNGIPIPQPLPSFMRRVSRLISDG
jgi:hypothetical protein